MALAIQYWLRDFTFLFPGCSILALEKLEADFAIKAKRHGKFPNLVLLKYDQINSPFHQDLVQDCRGIILDERNNWEVVCCTYRKFFNHGETLAAKIDWKSPGPRVYEKLDGSLIQVYYYAGDWHVATSGTPDGTAPVGDFGTSFADLFWKTMFEGGWGRGDHLDPECCYAFELCTPLNRVVVRHNDYSVWLHGVRNLRTFAEEDPIHHADRLGVPVAPCHLLGNLDEVLAASRSLDPLEQEGYVVVDRHFNRVKIKSPAYVALHHAKDGLLSRRMMANVIRRGEAEELRTALDAFPELSAEFEKLTVQHESMVFDAQVRYGHLIQTLPPDFTRKTFALEATKTPKLTGLLFHLLDKKPANEQVREALARSYFASLHEPAYMRLIDAKE